MTAIDSKPAPSVAPRPHPARRHRRRAKRPLVVAMSVVVAATLATPLAFLVIEASGAGVHVVWRLIWRQLTGSLLWNTVRLTLVVSALCAVIGTLAAWCVERTDLPGRRMWAVLVVIPFAIPDFVVSWGWASLSTWVQGFQGAVLVMTLAVYPLVYLPVAASLRNADPGLEEIARSLGMGRIATFYRVTLQQARGAILGGCVLVALVILAEYGAFEILGYQTFTTELYTEAGYFNIPAACALSFVLVLLGAVVLFGDVAARRGRSAVRTSSLAQRQLTRHALGPAKVPVLLGFTALVVLALGVPIYSCLYWIFEGGAHDVVGVSMLDAGWHTAIYSGSAAALSTAMALPVALLVVRGQGIVGRLLERTTFLVLAMPGVLVAFALSYFSLHYWGAFGYQSPGMLVAAYAILFFPLALVGVEASLAHAPARLEEVAQALGVSRVAALRRVTLPLVAPGLAASFCLVFLAAVTELTATLLLHPTNVQTLATQFWAYQTNLAYGQAAPFALVIIGLAAVPSYVLARFFDRLPVKATRLA